MFNSSDANTDTKHFSMSTAPHSNQPSTVPTVQRVLVLQHAGCGQPGFQGAGGPGGPANDAPVARGAQLGETELRVYR